MFGGVTLNKLCKLDLSNLDKRLKNVNIEVACDVDNPLTGEKGALYAFGPQKGATNKIAKILDTNLAHYAYVIRKELNIDIEDIPGAGAAGGLDAGLMAFLNPKLKSGVDVLYNHGITSIVCILNNVVTIDKALKNGEINMENASERTTRLLIINK